MKKNLLFVSVLVLSFAFYGCKSDKPVDKTQDTEEVVVEDTTNDVEMADTVVSNEEVIVKKTQTTAKKATKTAEEKAKEVKENVEKDMIDRLNKGKGKGEAKIEATAEEIEKAAEKKQVEEGMLNRTSSKKLGR